MLDLLLDFLQEATVISSPLPCGFYWQEIDRADLIFLKFKRKFEKWSLWMSTYWVLDDINNVIPQKAGNAYPIRFCTLNLVFWIPRSGTVFIQISEISVKRFSAFSRGSRLLGAVFSPSQGLPRRKFWQSVLMFLIRAWNCQALILVA